MNRETTTRIRETQSLNLADKLAAARAAAPAITHTVQPSLAIEPTVELFTLTGDELHDLVYASASTYLHTLSSMTRQRGHTHAERIASQGLAIARASDYSHRGVDPRG